MYQDRVIKKALNRQGVRDYQFDRFKLYNPNAYDKMLQQARVSIDVAVKDYKGIIQANYERY